jgi:HK97 family phage prohead protease
MTDNLRAAADLRRLAADTQRHDHGDIAYQQYRSTVAGMGVARRTKGSPLTQIRAVTERRGDKDLVHTSGYFTRYGRPYPMWDSFGEYREKIRSGSGAKTLAAKPEVAFLTNHGGMAMARTTSGTLDLIEDPDGGFHDGWLNPKRTDVADLVIAIDDKNVPQMSFAFMIPDGGGQWSADFADFEIIEYDIDGGDVSAVNFGANPFTDITAQTSEVLDHLAFLPAGAMAEARHRIACRDAPRGRIVVRHAARAVEPKASPVTRRMQGRLARTTDRLVDLGEAAGLTVRELATAQLPWYEVRATHPDTDTVGPDGERQAATDIFIFDEIGGSMGVTAKAFIAELDAITTPIIRLRINSPGGSVRDAITMRSGLLHHPSHVVSFVDGIAASAASIVALGGDEIETMEGAMWMLHNASLTADGQAVDLRRLADFLDRQSGNIAEMYAKRMNVPVEVAQKLMDAETWAFAGESVELGLADRIGGRNPAKIPADMAARMSRKHDLTRFAYRYDGRAAAPAPQQMRGGTGSSDPVQQKRSDLDPPMGRSISLIEAKIADVERR